MHKDCVFSSDDRYFYLVFAELAVVMYDTLAHKAAFFKKCDDILCSFYILCYGDSRVAYVDERVLLVLCDESIISLIYLDFENLKVQIFNVYNF